MIELLQVSKQFGQRTALDAVSLHVPSGEIFGLLGHNGAGKSTAIGLMLGQVWPTAGEVRVCGFDVFRHRGKALDQVGAIFETPVFYDYLSGWRNLEILCHYTGPVSPHRLKEVIEWVGLSGREQSKVRTYSHGMRARLALAQALLPNPRLLILDEPSDGLDPEGIHEMRQTILRLRQELGLTILLSSHLLNEVEQLCTRIAVLQRGCKVFEGGLGEIKRRRARIRLVTRDFAAAAQLLQQAGLAESCQESGRLLCASGADTSQWIELLVAHRQPVYELAIEEPSLEDFYLELMRKDGPVAPGTKEASH